MGMNYDIVFHKHTHGSRSPSWRPVVSSEETFQEGCNVVKRNNYMPRCCILKQGEQIGWSLLLVSLASNFSLTHSLMLGGWGVFLVRATMPLRDEFTRYCSATAVSAAQNLAEAWVFAKKCLVSSDILAGSQRFHHFHISLPFSYLYFGHSATSFFQLPNILLKKGSDHKTRIQNRSSLIQSSNGSAVLNMTQ